MNIQYLKSPSLPRKVDDNNDSARLGLRPQEQRAWLSGRWVLVAMDSQAGIVTQTHYCCKLV